GGCPVTRPRNKAARPAAPWVPPWHSNTADRRKRAPKAPPRISPDLLVNQAEYQRREAAGELEEQVRDDLWLLLAGAGVSGHVGTIAREAVETGRIDRRAFDE